MSGNRSITLLDSLFVKCPKCGARLDVTRSRKPRIDSSGFESYSFECKCGMRLMGIIDPYDNKFLLSDG